MDKEVKVAEWNSYFFDYVKYVGYIDDPWGRNGRRLLSLGRTPEEAIYLSKNRIKKFKDGGGFLVWRVADVVKNEE